MFSFLYLALNDGEYEVALKCANDANKAIDGHTKKTAHILTLQADSNSLHGYVLLILEGKKLNNVLVKRYSKWDELKNQ